MANAKHKSFNLKIIIIKIKIQTNEDWLGAMTANIDSIGKKVASDDVIDELKQKSICSSAVFSQKKYYQFISMSEMIFHGLHIIKYDDNNRSYQFFSLLRISMTDDRRAFSR